MQPSAVENLECPPSLLASRSVLVRRVEQRRANDVIPVPGEYSRQIGKHVVHRRVSIGRILPHASQYDRLEPGVKLIDQPRRRRRDAVHMMCEEAECGTRIERQLAGEPAKQDHAEGVNVRSGIHRVAQQLLRRHVLECTRDSVAISLRIVAASLRKAKVDQLHRVGLVHRAAKEDVLRLDVAMNQACLVHGLQRAAELNHERQRVLGGGIAVPRDVFVQGLAREGFENDIGLAIVGNAVVEELHDVGVLWGCPRRLRRVSGRGCSLRSAPAGPCQIRARSAFAPLRANGGPGR